MTTPPFLIAVAPNGARKGHSDHPAVPITDREIVREAELARAGGASMLHLHIRNRDGGHLLDGPTYADTQAMLRRELNRDMVIQITTEAVGQYCPDQQRAVVRTAKAEAVSLALRELVPDASEERDSGALFEECVRNDIAAQFILYDVDDLNRYRDLRQRGVIPDYHHSVLFVLGRYAANFRSQPKELIPFINEVEKSVPQWMVCAFGPAEGPVSAAVAAFGGHMRVGFENNLQLANGELATNNADLVAQANRASALAGRPVATPNDARKILRGDSFE